MTNSTQNVLSQLDLNCSDPLTELLKKGARDLIATAVEVELQLLLEQHSNLCLVDGRQAVVRNGFLPQRTIQTGIGDVEIHVPKIKDRSHSGIRFNSALLPPYLKRTQSIEEFIPWLYLNGISTGNFQEALSALLGDNAKGLSSNTICRLKLHWETEHQLWSQRDLSQKNYVYWWADGIYCNVRQEDRLCLLVIIGVTDQGYKELIAVEDGYRESSISWSDLLQDLKVRGLIKPPKLAIADGALGFWKALAEVFPKTKHQRCWVHKTANILNALPKLLQPKVKSMLHEIWMSDTKDNALKAFDKTVEFLRAKNPKAMEKLVKDRNELLAFYDFPAEHWPHIRTSNPIESTFATVRLRSKRTRNCGSRATTLAMVFKLVESAQKKWRRIRGFQQLALVVNNVCFKDGIQIVEEQQSLQETA